MQRSARRLGTPATFIVRCSGTARASEGRRTCGTPGRAPAGFRPAPLRAPPQVRNTSSRCRPILIQRIIIGFRLASRGRARISRGRDGTAGVANTGRHSLCTVVGGHAAGVDNARGDERSLETLRARCPPPLGELARESGLLGCELFGARPLHMPTDPTMIFVFLESERGTRRELGMCRLSVGKRRSELGRMQPTVTRPAPRFAPPHPPHPESGAPPEAPVCPSPRTRGLSRAAEVKVARGATRSRAQDERSEDEHGEHGEHATLTGASTTASSGARRADAPPRQRRRVSARREGDRCDRRARSDLPTEDRFPRGRRVGKRRLVSDLFERAERWTRARPRPRHAARARALIARRRARWRRRSAPPISPIASPARSSSARRACAACSARARRG